MASGSSDLTAQALALFERSLEEPSDQRAEWIVHQTTNSEIRKKALKYLQHDKSDNSAFQTGGAFHNTLDDRVIPEKIGAYRITGLIGHGGMGSVYRGERAVGDFEHDVAIKVVRPGAMSDKLIARFEIERRTLAKLAHPNIARLYDGGTLDNDAPYIVMELIDGLPITAWADEHQLSRNQRLKLFEDVCNAVSHAHQNLIIHRDITPSNVLVDKTGHVKLIDFGIAKPFDADASLRDASHSLASLSFTPGYAAPERSQGGVANTLSDIYSLGKLLDGITLSDHDDDLEAIINKATAVNPEARYETVGALKNDIQNYIGNFPIEAVQSSSTYRIKKFVTRHKIGTSLGLIATLALAVAFAVTIFQYQRAETALATATERFSETRELTSFLLNDFGEGLATLPGTLPLQKKVSETSTRYLDILAKAAIEDPRLNFELASGRMQLADLLTQSGGQHLGDPEEGLAQYEAAIELLSRLATEPGASAETRELYADAIQFRAYINRFHFDNLSYMPEAVKIARPIYEDLLREDSDNIGLQAKLLDLRFELWLLAADNNPDVTIDAELLSLKKELETLFKDDLSNDDYIINYGSFLYIAAAKIAQKWDTSNDIVTLAERKEYETLMDWSETGFQIMRQLYTESPSNPEAIYAYFWALESYLPLATIAAEWRPSLFDIGDRLGRTQNTETSFKKRIENKAEFQTNLKLAAQLKTYLETSDDLLERLKPFDDNTYSYLQAIYSTYRNKAYVKARLSFEFPEAESDFRASFSVPDQYLTIAPENDQVRLESVSLRQQLIFLLERREKVIEGSQSDKICKLLRESYELIFSDENFISPEQIKENNLGEITSKLNSYKCAI